MERSSTSGPAPPESVPGGRQDFSSLPAVARTYVILVIAAGALSLLLAFSRSGFERPATLAVLAALALAASAIKLDLPLTHGTSSLSISYAVDFAALLILGAPEATIVATAGAWSQCTSRIGTRNALHRTLFSMAALAVTLQVAGAVFDLARGVSGAEPLYERLRPLAFSALAYYLLNTALVAGAIGLSTGQNPVRIWRSDFMWSAPSYFVGAGAAAVVAAADRFGYSWWLLLVAVPCYLTYHSYRQFIERIGEERRQARRASDVQMAIIEALAAAIEAKDGTSYTQISRMQKFAAALARAAGLPAHELPGLQTATLLHDIGNLAVPEHILAKAGPLTEEEWEKVRIHPRVGAEILARVPFPYPVAPLILRHHEHWDGSGYPGGLKGEEIPLGARIMAVVDSYFSLSMNRPHRPALDEAAVLANMRRACGRILDPRLVEIFLSILPGLERDAAETAASGAATGSSPAKAGVLEDIAVAHQEAQSLCQIAQALGSSLAMDETINLVVANLRVLVPFSSFALFLKNDAARGFICRHACGVAQHRLRELVVASPADIAATLAQVNKGALPEEVLRYVAAAPLELNGTTTGLIAVYHTSRDYRTDDRRVLVRIAAQAAPVIRNSVVFEKTQQESFTDHLTGLPNRRAMLLYLNQQIGRAERHRSKLTLVMLDLNDFKDVNDRLGHQRGDHVLREIAAVLRSMVRAYDLCVRFGGDEFVVILWECDAEQADRRLRELKDAVKAAYFESQPGENIRLSASAGFAVYPDDGFSQEELIAVADRRMYEDKASRRSAADGPSSATEGAGPGASAVESAFREAPAQVAG
ncbi:MAG: diguanylate cyclase [Vicinamibacterales bacterium]